MFARHRVLRVNVFHLVDEAEASLAKLTANPILIHQYCPFHRANFTDVTVELHYDAVKT